MSRPHIVFDFVRGRAYRENTPDSLTEALASRAAKTTKPRVVKTVIGVPPSVVTQPKK